MEKSIKTNSDVFDGNNDSIDVFVSKWSVCHSMGTILNSPLVKNTINGRDVSQLNTIRERHDSSGDEFCNNSETERLHSTDVCDELIDENEDQFNWKLYKGIIYSSLSSVFFSLCSVIVKYLDDIHPGELAVFRFIGILLLTLPLVINNRSNPFGPKQLRHFLILRGLAGATSLFLRFCAFRYLPIADASVIIFSVPVFVSIFARIFLNESCGLFQTMSVMLTMIGLALTTKLPIIFGSDGDININSQFVNSSTSSILLNMTLLSDENKQDLYAIQKLHHIYGVLSALASTVFASSVFIFIRKAKGAHHSVIMFNFGWVAIIETIIITALMDGFSMPKTLFEWSLIILLGLFSFCGQILLTRSLQLEKAGPVSVVRAATDIALAFVWQLWLFNDIPDVYSIIGALIVTTCIIMTTLRKWLASLPEHSIIKSKFYFLVF